VCCFRSKLYKTCLNPPVEIHRLTALQRVQIPVVMTTAAWHAAACPPVHLSACHQRETERRRGSDS
ncbi:hypothetical protein INR49_006508, partial [Caranx melampygus]